MHYEKQLRISALATIKALISDKIIQRQDLLQFTKEVDADIYEPEYVRAEMEAWFLGLGIEHITDKAFSLQTPHFTKEEIKQAYEQDELIFCVPKGVRAKVLGKMFNWNSWAFDDPLVGGFPEVEDFWFASKKTEVPENRDMQGREIKAVYQREGKLGMNIERYLVFLARMRYLTGEIYDKRYKVWLVNNSYEEKAMLIAGVDSKNKFSVHAWMPNFNTPFVGGRHIRIPEHI